MSEAEPLEESESPFVLASEQLLAERGPLTLPELVQALRESGLDLGDEAEEQLEEELYDSQSPYLLPLLEDRWVHSLALMSGRIFTHRVSALEAEHDVLRINPDLEPVLVAQPGPRQPIWLTDGTPLSLAFPALGEEREQLAQLPAEVLDRFGVLPLPAGYLADRRIVGGDLIGLRITAAGVELTRLDEAELSADAEVVQDRLLSLLAVPPGPPQDLESVVLRVCADLPKAFRRPLPPLADLFRDAGLVHEGDFVAPAGFDFAGHFVQRRTERLREDFELTTDEVLTVLALADLHRRLDSVIAGADVARDHPDDEAGVEALRGEIQRSSEVAPRRADSPTGRTVADMLPFLAEPLVAEALRTETIGDEVDGAAALRVLAETLEEHVPRSGLVALRWLRAKADERLGSVLEAEESLRVAHRLDPDWPPVLLDLARYASDRGNAVGGLALIRRVNPEPGSWLLTLLEAYQPEPGPTLGRNEPCWCGSGRKFKQCHLHRPPELTLEERGAWLYQKAAMFLADGPWRSRTVEVALERAAYAATDTEAERAAADPLIADAVLFEGGAFEEFVETRGVLLPVDERRLAEQWLLIDRSVFEVTDVRPGEGLTVRDLRTGDVHDVRERTASRQLRSGALICTRIVPAGDSMQIFGGLEPITVMERDALLDLLDDEPEPEELVAFLSRRVAPARLTNTEGDPLVLNEATVTAPDLPGLLTDLDAAFERLDDTESPEWHEVREIDGFDRVLATLRLTEQGLAVSANSERRMEAVLSRLHDWQPGVTVTTHERQPIRDTREVAELAQRSAPSSEGLLTPDEQPPEVKQALAAHIRAYEQRWLDLSIPALGGRTPREAAEDPTRREDLRQLLARFEVDEDLAPTAMSPDRIRAALGL